MKKKKSICIFSHYSSETSIPIYVLIYVEELQRHFDELLLVTNTRKITNAGALKSPKVSIKEVVNEGYDMGMFYKGFQTINPDDYETIAFINDSNVLFGKLDFLFKWAKKQNIDFWGLIDSHAKPPFSTHTNNYHIQSHFIVFNKTAIPDLKEYVASIDLSQYINETNMKELRKKVINYWEIGLSQFLLSKNNKCLTYIKSSEYQQMSKRKREVNVSLDLYHQIIQNGIPVIKKKVVNSVQIKNLFTYKKNWKRLIRKYGDPALELDKMIGELSLLKRNNLKHKFSRAFQ